MASPYTSLSLSHYAATAHDTILPSTAGCLSLLLPIVFPCSRHILLLLSSAWQQQFPEPLPLGCNGQPVDCSFRSLARRNSMPPSYRFIFLVAKDRRRRDIHVACGSTQPFCNSWHLIFLAWRHMRTDTMARAAQLVAMHASHSVHCVSLAD